LYTASGVKLHTMAGRPKGKEVALQTEVDSQEDWEEVIGKEGLTGTTLFACYFNIVVKYFRL